MSRKVAVPLYDPTTVVPIQLTAEELEAILTKTEITKTRSHICWPEPWIALTPDLAADPRRFLYGMILNGKK